MPATAVVTAAMLVIGDEILSGRTRDVNINHIATELSAIGIRLVEARVVGDEAAAIVAALNTLRAQVDYVFTSGGIGPTHDDITADCVAQAFDWPLALNAEARALLLEGYGGDESALTESRLRMARIPLGASLIHNSESWAPGFRCENVHVMAGVPHIFRAMLAGVLPTLRRGAVLQSLSVRVEKGESRIAAALRDLQAQHPAVAIGSYPFAEDGLHGTYLVARAADSAQLAAVQRGFVAIRDGDS